MDAPKMLQHLAAQPTTGGFKPINGTKRSLTPTSPVAISSPLKRLAVDTAPKLATDPEHRTGCRISSNHPQAFNNQVEFAEQCLLPDNVRTSPIMSEATIEPETPPSALPLPRPHIAGSWREEADSWMNEFVNLDTIGDECFVPSSEASVGHYERATHTPSQSDAIVAKPFPHLDVENLMQPVQDEEVTMEDSTLDEYPFGDSDEEAMAIITAPVDDSSTKSFPSSLARNVHHGPRPTGSFDSRFHSSSSGVSHDETCKSNFWEPDFIDEDIDWDFVTACAKDVSSNPKTMSPAKAASTQTAKAPSIPAPIIRHPFPSKMRDRSVVVGLSSTTMMRTCFRIGELLNAHAKSTREKQDVVFELFARVRYSSRENLARVQHFQLQDLFTDRQPFLMGAFRDWKLNSSVDDHCRSYLGPRGEGKVCRCVCKLSDAKETVIGRWAMILSIRETTWDEIYWALRSTAREAPSDSG